MAETTSAPQGGATADEDVRGVDWEAVERSSEFQELVRKRRSFVVPATIFFLVWYMGFIALTAYAKDFMAERVYQGLTVGYCLALTQFLMVFALGLMYLRRASRDYDPLAERVVEIAGQTSKEPGGRFERDADRTGARSAGEVQR